MNMYEHMYVHICTYKKRRSEKEIEGAGEAFED